MPFFRLHAVLLLSIFCALSGPVKAQEFGEVEFATRAWETDEGIPHNGVNGIFQSRDGFLWLATQGGLVRFDGIDFVPRRSPLIINPRTSRVSGVIQENATTLLAACDVSGLVRLGKDGFSLHPMADALGGSRRINAILSEEADTFWVLKPDRQLWRWAKGKVTHFPSPVGASVTAQGSLARTKDGTVYVARGVGLERFDGEGLVRVPEIESRAITITSSSSGGLWIGSSDSMWKWDGGIPAMVASSAPWSSDPPTAMLEDREGAVWIGSKTQGLFRSAGTEFRSIQLSHSRITALHEDMEGNIWAGTAGGGLNLVQHARFQLLGRSAGWTPHIEGCVCECPPGKFWFANSGVGLRQVSDGRLHPAPGLEGWPTKAIPIFPDLENQLWVASNNQLLRINPDLNQAPERIGPPAPGRFHVIHVASDGTVWAGGEDALLLGIRQGEITSYGSSAGYTGKQAQAIEEDAAGDIWIGTEQGEIFRGRKGIFTKLPPLAGLDGSGIRALHGDAAGNLWIGTGGAGLFVGRAGKFTAITEEHGMPDSVISQMIEDDFGALWFGTSRALFKATKSELLDCAAGKIPSVTPVKYGKEDGLAGFSAAANYQPSAWKAKDGRLFFVSRKGLVITDPGMQPTERQGPQVHIEKLIIDGKPRALDDTRIPSAARKLDFQFTAPTFISPEKVRFRYRLVNFESDWNEGGSQRSASYSRLKPGKYRFEVMACNSDLVWNPKAAILPIEIVPAWWETWWARSLAMIAGAGLLAAAVRYWSHQRLKARLRELEATRRVDLERSRIARDLHDGLGAGLTQIGMMAEELAEDLSDMGEMKTYSGRLATRVRGIARDLDAAVWTVSPKNDTLAALSAYICQYAIEYFRETPVRCRVDLMPGIPDTPLSPDARHHLFLTAKEIMNNVLKHSGAGNVILAMRSSEDRFHLEISDDGCGFPDPDAGPCGRHGLQNIRERVKELGGTVEIGSTSTGTAIVIELPLSK
jgi:signal transduction histidine kinase/ligand-binding sensor domain-containing protein